MLVKRDAIICPRCGKKGFKTSRWVKSTYYPVYASEGCDLLRGWEYRLSREPNNVLAEEAIRNLRRIIRGNDYRGHSKYHITGHDKKEDKEYFDKSTAYRITSKKYFYDYIGHYSPEKYKTEMKDFRDGKRKSRPNGRIWHKVPVKQDGRRGIWYSN